jgi:uncharacterized protein (TIGR03067 family)
VRVATGPRSVLKRYSYIIALAAALPLLTALYFALAPKPPREDDPVVSAPPPAAAPPADKDRESELSGRWLVTGMETNGESVRPADWDETAWSFRGRTAVVTMRSLGAGHPERDAEFGYVTDAGQQPAQLTLKAADPRAGYNGIYKLEGNALIICWRVGGQSPRPREFKTRWNDGGTLVTLRRAP